MWRETTTKPANLKIFREELDAFLPEKILDFHVHVFPEGSAPAGETFDCCGHPITRYDLDDLRRDLPEFYPGRQTAAVCFGWPHPKYHTGVMDRYLAEGCDRERFFALRLFDPLVDTPETLRADLMTGHYYGIKPYPEYPRAADVRTVEIDQMLPPWAMEVVNDLGLLVMLHIPRPGRLEDPVNQAQLLRLCQNFPKAKIVLAHIGRSYYPSAVLGQLDRFLGLENLWYDTTMVCHWEVIAHTIQKVRPDRILYGTDLPLAAAAGASVAFNNQYTYVTPVTWKLAIHDDRSRLKFTSFLYEQLRAIKQAIEATGRDRALTEAIFWENGMSLLADTTLPAGS